MHAWLDFREREEDPVSPAVTPVVDIQLAVGQVHIVQFGNSLLERVEELYNVRFIDTV